MGLPTAGTFLAEALALLGTPYIFGGKSEQGIDCSGLVTVAFHRAGGPDWTQTHGSKNLWGELPPVSEPLHELTTCHLAFYGTGPEGIYHVGIILPFEMLLESGGGDHTTKTLAEAHHRGAKVRVRRSYHRSSLQGFRSLPLDYTK